MNLCKFGILQQIHSILQPKRYLEVGVGKGQSWSLVAEDAASIGIDPAPCITMAPRGKAALFEGTSDTFLSRYDPKPYLGGAIDLAFIDGMHLLDYTLRDFSNIERNTDSNSFVLIDGCFPVDKESAGRFPFREHWTGDVWKAILCLKEYRPDLKIDVLDTGDGGLAAVTDLKANNDHWCRELPAATTRYSQIPFEYLGDRAMSEKLLNVCDATPKQLQRIFGTARLSSASDTLAQVALG